MHAAHEHPRGGLRTTVAICATFALLLSSASAVFADNHTAPENVCPAPSGNETFPDVGDGPFANEIECLAGYEIAQGYSDGEYKAMRDVTRGEMAKFIFNLVETGQPGTLNPDAANTYDDVPEDSEFEDFISALTDANIVDGKSETTYDPTGLVTRDEMAKFVALSIEATTGQAFVDESDEHAFDDVPEDGVFTDYINSLAAEGIVEGDGQGSYNPRGDVDRGQMAAYIMRAAAYLDSAGAFEPTASPTMTGFTATDEDGDGELSSGDTLTLSFADPMELNSSLTLEDEDGDRVILSDEDPLAEGATEATFECVDTECTEVLVTVAGTVTVAGNGDGTFGPTFEIVAADGIVDAETGVEYDPAESNPDNEATIPEDGGSDTTAPSVVSTDPTDQESDVARTASPQAQFDESLADASDASLSCDSTEVAGTSTVDGDTITFAPDEELPAYTDCTATFQVEDAAGNATTETVTFTTVLPQDATATGSDADDVSEVATDTTAYWRVQTERPDGTSFNVSDADRVLWVEDGEVHDLTGDGADALYLRRPDEANHEVTVYYELDGTWLQLTAAYNEVGYLASINGDPHRPDQVATEPAASASDASDVEVVDSDPAYYRVETRDASGTSFDVRNAETVLWVEDGQVHDLTNDQGAEALYLRRPDDAFQTIAVYYELTTGEWVQIVAQYDGNGDLASINGDPYTGPHDVSG